LGLRVGASLLNPVARGAKRLMDWSITIPIILLASPVFVVVAMAVRLTSPGPIIYGSERIGKERRRFRAWKFRTMHVHSEDVLRRTLEADERLREEWERTNKLRRDPRITAVGRSERSSGPDRLVADLGPE
jgi:lipopolysaccharide/colanic/teichoic acid biosynthesis glycosyltransferase